MSLTTFKIFCIGFMFRFHMWYDMSQHRFLWVHSSFGFAQFLECIGLCPLSSLGSFQPLYLWILIQLRFSILFIVDSGDTNISSLRLCSLFFFQSIFFVSFSLDNLYWSSFFPCLLRSAVEPIHWGFFSFNLLFYFSVLKLPFGFRPYLLFIFWDVLIFQLFQACS